MIKTTIPAAIAAALLTGCTTVTEDLGGQVRSVTDAGISSYEHVQGASGERTTIVLGKEVQHWSAELSFTPDGQPTGIAIEAHGVSAFAAQAAAAGAVVAVRSSLSARDQAIWDSIADAVQEALRAYLAPTLRSAP